MKNNTQEQNQINEIDQIINEEGLELSQKEQNLLKELKDQYPSLILELIEDQKQKQNKRQQQKEYLISLQQQQSNTKKIIQLQKQQIEQQMSKSMLQQQEINDKTQINLQRECAQNENLAREQQKKVQDIIEKLQKDYEKLEETLEFQSDQNYSINLKKIQLLIKQEKELLKKIIHFTELEDGNSDLIGNNHRLEIQQLFQVLAENQIEQIILDTNLEKNELIQKFYQTQVFLNGIFIYQIKEKSTQKENSNNELDNKIFQQLEEIVQKEFSEINSKQIFKELKPKDFKSENQKKILEFLQKQTNREEQINQKCQDEQKQLNQEVDQIIKIKEMQNNLTQLVRDARIIQKEAEHLNFSQKSSLMNNITTQNSILEESRYSNVSNESRILQDIIDFHNQNE